MPRETKRGREKKWENEPRAFDYAGLEPIGVVQNTERTILENRKLSINYRNARAVDCDLLSLSGYSWYRWLAGSPIRWLVATRNQLENSVDRSSGSRDCVYATAKPTIGTTTNYRENECHCVAEHGSRNNRRWMPRGGSHHSAPYPTSSHRVARH